MVLLLAFVFGMGVPVAAYDGGNDDAALDLQLVDSAMCPLMFSPSRMMRFPPQPEPASFPTCMLSRSP